MSGYRQISKSPIARKPELATFIIQAYETMTTAEVRDACIKKFGVDNAPSMSAIHRFILASRRPFEGVSRGAKNGPVSDGL